MKTPLDYFENLAKTLATLFHPMAEVALLDKNDQVIAIFNRLTVDTIASENKITKVRLNKKQQGKIIKLPLSSSYSLRILVETTWFDDLQSLLQKYLAGQTLSNDATDWEQLVDNVIDEFCIKEQMTLSALSSQQKRSLILLIHQKDFFRYQDATKYLAAKLNVSRATIYNYLKQGNELKALEVHQVDAFTDEPFSGNPAGVVLEADHLNDSMMKKIAREMNLSETSFLLPSSKADLRLRYFTPNGSEVKFCGHSTVGALYMLAHKKMFGINRPGQYPLTLETQLGVLPVSINLKSNDAVTVQFRTPAIKLVSSHISYSEIAQALGISPAVIDVETPIMFEKNNQDLYIRIKSLKDLETINIDQKSAKQFSEEHNIVALALICTEAISPKNHIHMRCFAPLVGIPEDPFTGSVLGGLAAYIVKNKLINRRIKTIGVEQGHFMARPGHVDMALGEDENSPPLIIAKARHFFSTQINL